jgi:hypothetical protein
LIVSDFQLQMFRAAVEEAAVATASDLGRAGVFPWELRVTRAALCCLSDFPERAVFCPEELMASIVLSHHGRLPGTAVLSFEPPHAFQLIRSLSLEGDPLETFRTTIANLVQGLLTGFLTAGEGPVAFGEPCLEENSLVATVLSTHAPPDTLVVSLELGFVSPDHALPSYLYWLLDAKLLENTLGMLCERTQRRSNALA